MDWIELTQDTVQWGGGCGQHQITIPVFSRRDQGITQSLVRVGSNKAGIRNGYSRTQVENITYSTSNFHASNERCFHLAFSLW
jgi:hypothetical protein